MSTTFLQHMRMYLHAYVHAYILRVCVCMSVCVFVCVYVCLVFAQLGVASGKYQEYALLLAYPGENL